MSVAFCESAYTVNEDDEEVEVCLVLVGLPAALGSAVWASLSTSDGDAFGEHCVKDPLPREPSFCPCVLFHTTHPERQSACHVSQKPPSTEGL